MHDTFQLIPPVNSLQPKFYTGWNHGNAQITNGVNGDNMVYVDPDKMIPIKPYAPHIVY